ncbi:hypothetical protein [Alteromonas facilis]|uniref:hypothetical protein n=1 Tax=Alteromonas facilis TaxID=2048004 RepID=UPI0013DB14D6|nr:hypothetical protein [Alteromonas facilis]
MKLGFSFLFALACAVTRWMLGSIDGLGIWTVMIGAVGVMAVIGNCNTGSFNN